MKLVIEFYCGCISLFQRFTPKSEYQIFTKDEQKHILTSDLLLKDVDLALQTPDLHLLVCTERAFSCLVLQGLHRLSRLCNTFLESKSDVRTEYLIKKWILNRIIHLDV